jgi:hypothetical protein
MGDWLEEVDAMRVLEVGVDVEAKRVAAVIAWRETSARRETKRRCLEQQDNGVMSMTYL